MRKGAKYIGKKGLVTIGVEPVFPGNLVTDPTLVPYLLERADFEEGDSDDCSPTLDERLGIDSGRLPMVIKNEPKPKKKRSKKSESEVETDGDN